MNINGTEFEQPNEKKIACNFLQMHYDVRCPNGYSKMSKGVLGDDYFLSIGLIENLDDCSHRIRMNDIGTGRFKITQDEKGLILERLEHTLSCNPIDKYCAMSLQKIPFRKIRAKNHHELVEKFDKYLTKWFLFVNEKVEKNEIYNQEKYNVKYFQFN